MQALKSKAKKIYQTLLASEYPIPFFDAYEITTTRDSCGVGMMLFSSIYHRNEIYFGIVIALGSDMETKFHTKRCLEIIKNNRIQEEIIGKYPNWGTHHSLTLTLVNEDILIKSKYLNFKTPYLFKTPKINDFSVGYQNVINKYKESRVNLIGLPEVEGIESSLLFINNEFIVYHNNKPINISDTYGLGAFVEKNKNALGCWVRRVSSEHGITEPFVMDFIWAGGHMRPYSSVVNIEKFIIVYFIGCYNVNTNNVIWKEPVFSITDKSIRIFDIRAIKQYRFNLNTAPQAEDSNIALFKSFNKEIEYDCPIAKYFNKENREGAGIIWHVEFNESIKYYFLVRNSNKLNKNITKVNRVDEFLQYVLTQNRLISITKIVGTPTPKNLSYFIAELYSNILLTEEDYIKNNAIDLEDLEQEIWKAGAKWYRNQYFSK